MRFKKGSSILEGLALLYLLSLMIKLIHSFYG